MNSPESSSYVYRSSGRDAREAWIDRKIRCIHPRFNKFPALHRKIVRDLRDCRYVYSDSIGGRAYPPSKQVPYLQLRRLLDKKREISPFLAETVRLLYDSEDYPRSLKDDLEKAGWDVDKITHPGLNGRQRRLNSKAINDTGVDNRRPGSYADPRIARRGAPPPQPAVRRLDEVKEEEMDGDDGMDIQPALPKARARRAPKPRAKRRKTRYEDTSDESDEEETQAESDDYVSDYDRYPSARRRPGPNLNKTTRTQPPTSKAPAPKPRQRTTAASRFARAPTETPTISSSASSTGRRTNPKGNNTKVRASQAMCSGALATPSDTPGRTRILPGRSCVSIFRKDNNRHPPTQSDSSESAVLSSSSATAAWLKKKRAMMFSDHEDDSEYFSG